MTRKVAILMPGWGATHKIWYEHQKVKNGSPLIQLFQDFDYEAVTPSPPERFVSQDKGFHWYANYLAGIVEDETEEHITYPICECCGRPETDKEPTRVPAADEITIVAHSMGGLATRLYLKSDDIGDPSAKRKVNRAITLASPHHGTGVPIMEIVAALANVFVFMGSGSVAYDILGTTLCYQEAKPGSELMAEVNTAPESPGGVDFHSIWTRGDRVVSPRHTAVVTGASNYCIDHKNVRHNKILWSIHSTDIVRNILEGEPTPTDLQRYPSNTGCTALEEHNWMPKAFPQKNFLWECRNQGCNATGEGRWHPSITGCDIGIIPERLRWHKWRRTGRKKYKCAKCGKTVTKTKRPKRRGNCRRPFRNYHRWRLVEREWECKNDGCEKVEWSKWKPQRLGCEEGLIKNRNHFWQKKEKRFIYEFECAGCGKEATMK